MKLKLFLVLTLATLGLLGAADTNIETFRFSGRVVDTERRAITGALIECFKYSGVYSPEGLKLEQSVATDTNGTFEMKLSKVTTLLLVRKTGLAPAWKEWNPAADEEQQIVLKSPAVLAGEVKEENGKPVPDARVWVSAAYTEEGGEDGSRRYEYLTAKLGRELFTSRTGADGRFRIEGFPTNGLADLAVSKPGKVLRQPQRDYVSPETMRCRAGQQDITLVLDPGGTVEGRVRSLESGEPLAGVEIQLEGRMHGWPGVELPKTSSGADGKFQLTEVGAGNYRAVPRFGTNKLAEWVAEMVLINVESGRTTRDIEISATKGGFLQVLTLGKTDRKPMEDVGVTVSKESFRGHAGSDKDGVALLRVPPGDYQVTAYKDLARSEGTSATAEAGQTNRLELELNPAPRLAGVVRDTAGAPVSGLTVTLFGGYSSPNAGQTRTDESGRFELKWNPQVGGADRGFCLVATDPARNLGVSQEVDEQTTKLELRLEPGLAVSGRIEDLKGKPLTNGTVQVHIWIGNMGSQYEPKPLKTDAQGRFRIAGLPGDRRFTLWANASGYGSANLNVESGSDTNEIQLETIVLKTADLKLAGRVVDADDKPTARVWVNIYGDGQPSGSTRTDDGGQFRFEQVCEGRIQVSAYLDRSYGNVVTEGGDTNVILRLGANESYPSQTPKRRSLKGATLPELAGFGLPGDCAPAGKPVLLCLVDIEQRPSRRFLTKLAEQNESLRKKDVTIIGLQAAVISTDSFAQWKDASAVPFALGRLTEKTDQTKWASEVESFPWLILTDSERKVVAEGFPAEELEAELAKALKR
jgi:protocatechuate 3,4-dioxygenase beta subunit